MSEFLPHHREFLDANFLGMLTTLRQDGQLSTNPVGYVWDGATLKVSTLKSRVKVQSLLGDARVCLCVQSRTDPMAYIEVRGKAAIEPDQDRAFFREQFRRGTGGTEPPEDLDPPGAERVIIVIHPEQISSPQIYPGKLDEYRG